MWIDRKIKFRDANMKEVELRVTVSNHFGGRNWSTLRSSVDGYWHLEVDEKYDTPITKLLPTLKPRTETQERLIEICKYDGHWYLPGTKLQMEYINGQRYRDDFQKFMDNIVAYYDAKEKNWPDVFKDIYDPSNPDNWNQVNLIIIKNMRNNPIGYIWGDGMGNGEHGPKDLNVQKLFLAARGLLFDRKYEYGSEQLIMPLPKGLAKEVDAIADRINIEEWRLTNKLEHKARKKTK